MTSRSNMQKQKQPMVYHQDLWLKRLQCVGYIALEKFYIYIKYHRFSVKIEPALSSLTVLCQLRLYTNIDINLIFCSCVCFVELFNWLLWPLVFKEKRKIRQNYNITRQHSACLLLNYPPTHKWRLLCVNKRETDIAAWA